MKGTKVEKRPLSYESVLKLTCKTFGEILLLDTQSLEYDWILCTPTCAVIWKDVLVWQYHLRSFPF